MPYPCRAVTVPYLFTLIRNLHYSYVRLSVKRAFLYLKILRSSRCNLTKESAGYVFNLVSNDAQRMEGVIIYFIHVAFPLVNSLLSVLLLFMLVGWQSISGAFVVFVVCCLQFMVGRLFAKYRIEQAAATDKRLTAMNEIIRGIRAVKMYAWEWNFRDMIKILRR